jgi:hypothetical protein
LNDIAKMYRKVLKRGYWYGYIFRCNR